MDWFNYAVITTIIWAISAILLKISLRRLTAITYMVLTTPAAFCVLIVLLMGPFTLPPPKVVLFIGASALAAFLGYWCWLKAISKEDISKIMILNNFEPLLVLFLASLFLKETLTLYKYLAFPLIITRGVLISVEKVKEKIVVSPAIIWLFLAILLYAIQALIFKYVSYTDFISMMIIRQMTYFMLVVLVWLLSSRVRMQVMGELRRYRWRSICWPYAAEVLGIAGLILYYVSVQGGPVSLVALINATQSLAIIGSVVLISRYAPQILKEKVDRKSITLKIISALLMIGGLYLTAL